MRDHLNRLEARLDEFLFQAGTLRLRILAQCGVDLGAYTVTGTVGSVSSNQLVIFYPARSEPGPSGGQGDHPHQQGQSALGDLHCARLYRRAGGLHFGRARHGTDYRQALCHQVRGDRKQLLAGGRQFDGLHHLRSGGKATPLGDVGYFDYGLITMTSEASNGRSSEVKAYGAGTIKGRY